MVLFISVSFGYGAEEFFWKSKFTHSNELIQWWFEEAQLNELEEFFRSSEYCIPIIHNGADDDNNFSIYDLFLNNPFQISLIDNFDHLSYLLFENKKMYKNGIIEIINLNTEIDLSVFGLD